MNKKLGTVNSRTNHIDHIPLKPIDQQLNEQYTFTDRLADFGSFIVEKTRRPVVIGAAVVAAAVTYTGVRVVAEIQEGVCKDVPRTEYVVRSGETIFSIAEDHKGNEYTEDVADLIAAENQMANPNEIVAGQTLIIPRDDC